MTQSLISVCVADVKVWMNKHKLNDEKNELLAIGDCTHLSHGKRTYHPWFKEKLYAVYGDLAVLKKRWCRSCEALE